METKINSKAEIPQKSNKESGTKVGRAILRQGKIREYWEMEGMKKEGGRVRESDKKNETGRKKY